MQVFCVLLLGFHKSELSDGAAGEPPFSQDSLAGTNMHLRAVTGPLLGVGVAKEQRRTGGDVSKSTSPVQS